MATLILGLIAVDVLRVVVTRELTHTVALLRTAEINDTLLLAEKNVFLCFKNDFCVLHMPRSPKGSFFFLCLLCFHDIL